MSALDRFSLVAASVASPREATWSRFRDPQTGFSFEIPFLMQEQSGEGLFDAVVEGRMTLPYVFDVSYMASRERSDASPRELTYGMATQWMVDYDIVLGPSVREVVYPGIDEAWALHAEIQDEPGTIGYSWLTLLRDGRIGCLGVSCWTAEWRGREALHRTLGSISGA